MSSTGDDDDDGQPQVTPGAQLEAGVVIDGRCGQRMTLIPILVDFARLLASKSSVKVVKGVSNQHLMHSVVALHDLSLSDMTPDVLYSSVCSTWARNIVLLRDVDETVTEVESKRQLHQSTIEASSNKESLDNKSSFQQSDKGDEDKWEDCETKEDVYCPEEAQSSTFADVFSDYENEDSEDDSDAADSNGTSSENCDDEDEEDFSKGIHSFLRSVRERRKRVRNQKTPVNADDIGINNRIVAAVTFEKKIVGGSQKIVHLTLISVRRQHQKCGIGKYLIKLIKNPSVVGPFEAAVVHADNSAVDFFKKNGFSDDVILNKRWSEIAEQYTHCTLMCYLPTFAQYSNCNSTPELDLLSMDAEIEKWRSKSVDAYQAEMSCVLRMRQEIINLRAVVGSQQDTIDNLTAKNEQLEFETFKLKKDLMKCQLLASVSELENLVQSTHDCFRRDLNGDGDMDSDEDSDDFQDVLKELNLTLPEVGCLSSDISSDVKLYILQNNSHVEEIKPNDEGSFELKQALNDFSKAVSSAAGDYTVHSVTMAESQEKVRSSFSATIQNDESSSMTKRLYFNGSCHNAQQILQNGFSSQDFTEGPCGSGLYFSTHPLGILNTLTHCRIIVTEVVIGNAKVIKRNDSEKTVFPSESNSNVGKDFMEYVIYDAAFSCPLFILEIKSSAEIINKNDTLKRPCDDRI